ncbi:hypothetical protein DdX_12513 [Ditylenchus destructor]|uniref:Uncharacterized protein n=1 Tax=Ditylenchus destructor TaxID=166010 RepID=A0AAD4R3P9_9BILA|nr:hypothetical protein DdX_12513 [Ditylenchus destructor]
MARNRWLLLHINPEDGTSLFWSPSRMRQRLCTEPIQLAHDEGVDEPDREKNSKAIEIGGWYEAEKDHQLGISKLIPVEPSCDSRIRKQRLEVRAPVVFFSDNRNYNLVGFAPGFGRLGCFVPNSFLRDKMYMAWITFGTFLSSRLQHYLEKYNVNWVIMKQDPILMTAAEMDSMVTMKPPLYGLELSKGIVVEKAENMCRIFSHLYGVCKCTLTGFENIQLGDFVKFFALENFSGSVTAVSITLTSSLAEGISLHAVLRKRKPIIILSAKGWNYDSDQRMISVPGWCESIPVDQQKFSGKKIKMKGSDILLMYDDEIQYFKPTFDESEQSLNGSISNLAANRSLKERNTSFEKPSTSNGASSYMDNVAGSKYNSQNGGLNSLAEIDDKRIRGPPYENGDEISTDAVILYVTDHGVSIFAIRTGLDYSRFEVDKYLFEPNIPTTGDWFHVLLRFGWNNKATVLDAEKIKKQVLPTHVYNLRLLQIYTKVVVTGVSNLIEIGRYSVCGYSPDLGPVIDNARIFKESDVGKTMDTWVLSASIREGANWRVFAPQRKPKHI